MTDSSKEPIAGLSAASSCIKLSLSTKEDGQNLSSPFRPVFTHQCFGEKEFIPGWRPLIEAEEESRQIYLSWREDGNGNGTNGGSTAGNGGKQLHASYKNCYISGPSEEEARIDVHIVLSPSCEKCRVEIQTEKYGPSNDNGTEEPAPKKQKTVSFAGASDDNAEEVPAQQMNIKDIVQKISSAVPPIESVAVNGTTREDLVPHPAKEQNNTANGEDIVSNSRNVYLKEPIGKVLSTYHRKIKGNNSSEDEEAKFLITLADGSDPSVATYHNAVQPLARWYIETADDVDLTDDTRGTWKVMYLFREHSTTTSLSGEEGTNSQPLLSLAGYMTLLHVHSPFRKPKPGIIVRICQALVLPPYHRAGHGSTLLESVHNYADTYDSSSTGMDIVEINVEDPAPAFVALRDSVDFQRFVRKRQDCTHLEKYTVTDKEYFLPVPEDKLLEVAECLKITKRQSQIVHDIHKLCEVRRWKKSLADTNNTNQNELVEEVDKHYRLMIKKSLRSLREEELGACEGGKEEQKALLGKWFDETMVLYERVLRSKTHVS